MHWNGEEIGWMEFPAHWGKPPVHQTMDVTNLPGHFGRGSSTLRAWVTQKMEEDQYMDNYWLILRGPWAACWVYIGWICVVLYTIILKRQSLRPGGYLYNYDKQRILKEKTNRRRRLRDTLNDPLLVKHWEKKLMHTLKSEELVQTEMRKWREAVDRWEQQGDDDFKDALFYRRKGKAIVPSLNMITAWLFTPLYFFIVFPNDFTWMYAVLAGAHLIDNIVLRRKYQKVNSDTKSSPYVTEKDGDVCAVVGIPAAQQVTTI